jgi:excisionase family DNA binding protein
LNEPAKNPFEPFFDEIRRIVRDEIKVAGRGNGHQPLLTSEALAQQLSVPVSWVYEQSRQGRIPTHKIGRYLRFDLAEVIEAQKKRSP